MAERRTHRIHSIAFKRQVVQEPRGRRMVHVHGPDPQSLAIHLTDLINEFRQRGCDLRAAPEFLESVATIL